MKISWHLLYEQLQNNPELLEDDVRGERLDLMPQNDALSNETQDSEANITAEKETQAMLKLQARLGNAGFEKLLARQQFMKSSSAKSSTKRENKLESQLKGESEEIAMPAEPIPLAKPMPISRADDISAINESDKKRSTQSIKTSKNKQKSINEKILNKSDITERLNLLLQQFLNNLPVPAFITWKSLSDTFKQLPANKQGSVVSVLVNRLISLPTDQQARFTVVIQNLPAGLAQSDLVAALNAQLLNRTAVAESPSIELPVIPFVVSSEGA